MSFPSDLHTTYTLVDNTDDVLATHPNVLSAEITLIETKLGLDNSTDNTSIDYFLKHASGAYRTHHHDGSSDDGAALDWDTCWSDAVHSHASDAEGGLLDWDTCWTDAVHSHLSNAEGGTLSLPASVITSEIIATARLGSGTASSSTFLRGDQTWAVAQIGIGTVEAKSDNTVYEATTDGFVVGYSYCDVSTNAWKFYGYVGNSSPPTTIRWRMATSTSGGCLGSYFPMCMPVKKGEYWMTKTFNYDSQTTGDVPYLIWIPIGV